MNYTRKKDTEPKHQDINDYSKVAFFKQLLFKNPIVFYQLYNASSILTSALLLDKLDNPQLGPTKTVLFDDIKKTLTNAVYGHKKQFVDEVVFIADPWCSLDEIVELAYYTKELYIATSQLSHYYDMKRIGLRMPENLHFYFSVTDTLLASTYKVLEDKQVLSPLLSSLNETVLRKNILDRNRISIMGHAKNIDVLIETLRDQTKEYLDNDLGSFTTEAVVRMGYNKIEAKMSKFDYRNLSAFYYNAELGDSFDPAALLLEAKRTGKQLGYEAPEDILVQFSVMRNYIHFDVTALRDDIRLLKLLEDFDPVGDDHRVVIRGPFNRFSEGFLLDIR